MTKNFLFAAALLSLAFATGCAVGGNGPCVSNCALITVTGASGNISPVSQAPIGGTITFTATFKNTTQNSVNWSLTGSSCSGSDTSSSNPCGYFTATTATTASYQAPSTVPSNTSVTVVATASGDSSLDGTTDLTIVHITTAVTPVAPNVGAGLTQQFTAVAAPDNAPQTFTWTCTAGSVSCANFKQDSKISGVAYYTAADCASGCTVKISAVSAADPAGCTAEKCTTAKATIVSSRLSGTYAFKFSGYDSSNKPVIAAGTFTATNGTINNGGVEDVIDSSGFTPLTITGGSYQPTSSDPDNSNNAGTLTISTNSGTTHYLAVLDSAGDIQFIESDANGKGSGVAEKASGSSVFNSAAQSYAFGLTGADASSARIGFAGVLSLNGSTGISSGQMDVNDNGNSSNGICSSPCSVTGSYSYNASTNVGTLTLTATASEDFDFFAANGSANTNNPVNVYIISKGNTGGTIDATHPAVVGTMVLQDSTITTYNNAALNGPSISALTGTNSNVSLTNGNADGNGGFAGTFDWNNDGTMVSVPPEVGTCATPTVCSFANTYAASSPNNGRYTLQMLGNPNGSPAVAALPFVLYASSANSGFLLEADSATSVITGTMTAQLGSGFETFQPAALAGTFAAATATSSSPSIAPLTMNLLLTSPGNAVFNVTGTENPGGIAITGGAYGVDLTVSPTPALSTTTGSGTSNYVLYDVDVSHFYLMRDASKDAGVPSAILFVAE